MNRAASLPGERGLSARQAVIVWLALVGAALLLHMTPPYAQLEGAVLDAQFRALRTLAPKPARADVVILGIDEATLAATREPLALWHRPLALLLDGLRLAQPRGVGLDMQLPDRSYDALQPGIDRELYMALSSAARAFPLTAVLGIDATGAPHTIHPPFLAALGDAGVGLATWLLDPDGTPRRFDERQGEGGAVVPTLAGTLARRLGATPGAGLIDYAAGPAFEYVPAKDAMQWARAGDAAALARAFGGRVVMIGSVLPFDDRHRLPVPLAAWEDALTAPGVVIHAQALRSLLGAGLVREAPGAAVVALLAAACALWFAGARSPAGIALFAAFAFGAVAGSTVLLFHRMHVPVGTAVLAAASSLALRIAYEAWFNRRLRQRLRQAFAGAVSPAVLDLIMRGQLDGALGSGRRQVAVMFGDIRGFTPMTEARPPEEVVALLNRYFTRVTAAVHGHNGTIDNFRGDGIMCVFGAPKASTDPCRDGFSAAQDILDAIVELNAELEAEGRAPIRIGLSLAYGEAVVGRIGSPDRNEYTAIGDVANVSARIEGLTAELGYPVLVDGNVAAALAPDVRFDALGERPLKGHSPVRIHGWPARMPRVRSVEEEAA